MGEVLDVVGLALAAAGCLFVVAGTVGLLRFPDALSRLHALPKADNLGLGLIAAGMALQAREAHVTLLLAATWLLALLAGAVCAYLIAGEEVAGGADGRDDG
ncbi:MAG TPA: monovalent cation/H(+) antiporter subunit G [Miltoncostaeaceae bacterium]|nr:monovalent cation/H(+) antiporter subunit G [Miltoncostaeaceae bacterium]